MSRLEPESSNVVNESAKKQSLAVKEITNHFLELFWLEDVSMVERKSRLDKITSIIETADRGLDAYWTCRLFYELEHIAHEHLSFIIALAQTTEPEEIQRKFNKIPDALVKSIKHLHEFKSDLDKRLSAQRGGVAKSKNSHYSKVKPLVEEEWIIWQKSKSRYSSQLKFAETMVSKFKGYSFSPETVVKKWIPEWTKKRKKTHP